MRTKFMIWLITVSLLIAGCSTTSFQSRPILPAAGQTELSITATGSVDNKYSMNITISGDQTITIDDNDDVWYYDVPEGEQEYALIETSFGQIYYVHIHLHSSKRPQ